TERGRDVQRGRRSACRRPAERPGPEAGLQQRQVGLVQTWLHRRRFFVTVVTPPATAWRSVVSRLLSVSRLSVSFFTFRLFFTGVLPSDEDGRRDSAPTSLESLQCFFDDASNSVERRNDHAPP